MTAGVDLPAILSCARELYGRAVYSHKTHEVERELWAKVVFRMNIGNICLAAATTVAAVIAASLKPTWAMILTAVLASASICFVVWQASFDPAGKEAQHRVHYSAQHIGSRSVNPPSSPPADSSRSDFPSL